jgi:hypothetical protein
MFCGFADNAGNLVYCFGGRCHDILSMLFPFVNFKVLAYRFYQKKHMDKIKMIIFVLP